MKHLSFIMAAFMLFGCGPEEAPYTDNSQDPAAYAQDVKQLIATAARQAKRSNEPNDYLSPLLHELQRTDRPLGEFQAVYDDLRTRAEQLVLDCEQAGNRAPNLAGRLDELVKVAQTLPSPAPAAPPAN